MVFVKTKLWIRVRTRSPRPLDSVYCDSRLWGKGTPYASVRITTTTPHEDACDTAHGRPGRRGDRRVCVGAQCSPDWNERRKAPAAVGGKWGGMEWRSVVRRGRDRLSAELAIALGGGSSAPPQPQHQQERGRRSG